MLKKSEDNPKKIQDLESRLELKFHNIALLARAMTHRSYLNEHTDPNVRIEHNERLEFLGDAVLEMIMTEYLFHKYPKNTEGELTSFRAAVVRTESLAETSQILGLGEFLMISKGEEMTGGREKPYLLANTFEALLGAIYIDQGYEIAKSFVYKTLVPKIQKIVENRLDRDSKSHFQELAQEHTSYTPVYRLVNAEGPDHDKTFTMEVSINSFIFATGVGKSKQSAEQNAAGNALEKWDVLLKAYQTKHDSC